MANNFTTVKIDADVSGMVQGVGRADSSLSAFGSTLEAQHKNVVRFGGAIQKASGPHGIMGIKPKAKEASASLKTFQSNVQNLNKSMGEGGGLRSNINNLETPLRDVEGSFDRVAMATRVWGNTSETASEKATVGFLLAADAIATFTSGGVAGIAIAAAVAGFAMLAKAMQDEATAADKAKKAQDEHMKALQAVGKSAVDAGMSIAALNAQEAASAAMGGLRAAEENLRLGRLKLRQLKDEVLDRRALRREVVTQGAQATIAFDRQSAALARQFDAQQESMKGLGNAVSLARTKAKQDVAFYLDDLRASQESAVTSAIKGFKRLMDQGSKAIKDTGEKAVRTAEESTQKISELDRRVMADNAAFDRSEREEMRPTNWASKSNSSKKDLNFGRWTHAF
jgi:hypothetical protein